LKSFLQQQKAKITVVCGAVTVIDTDGSAALERARQEVALYLPVVAELDTTVTIEPERLNGIRDAMKQYDVDKASSYISDDLLRKFAFAGTPDEIIEQVLNLFEAGADRIEFGTPHGLSSENGLALLGEIVLPSVHSALSR
jgi:5,10-methylenetetrahydromethanopterin reductase